LKLWQVQHSRERLCYIPGWERDFYFYHEVHEELEDFLDNNFVFFMNFMVNFAVKVEGQWPGPNHGLLRIVGVRFTGRKEK